MSESEVMEGVCEDMAVQVQSFSGTNKFVVVVEWVDNTNAFNTVIDCFSLHELYRRSQVCCRVTCLNRSSTSCR